MEKIKRVGQIIRLGRIDRIGNDSIIFNQGGTISTDSSTLHVDCTAAGTNFPPVKEKTFDGNRINLQMVQNSQPCTSGAMLAAIELK